MNMDTHRTEYSSPHQGGSHNQQEDDPRSKTFILIVQDINRQIKRLKITPDEIAETIDLGLNTMRKHKNNSWKTLDVDRVYKLLSLIEQRSKERKKNDQNNTN